MAEIFGVRFVTYPGEKPCPGIVEANGGKCWKIYAPGSNYTQIDRKTFRGAVAYARKLWGNVDMRVIYLNGNTALI